MKLLIASLVLVSSSAFADAKKIECTFNHLPIAVANGVKQLSEGRELKPNSTAVSISVGDLHTVIFHDADFNVEAYVAEQTASMTADVVFHGLRRDDLSDGSIIVKAKIGTIKNKVVASSSQTWNFGKNDEEETVEGRFDHPDAGSMTCEKAD